MDISESGSGSENTGDNKERPVMCCHPAENGVTAQLVRGGTPSTPRRRRSERRRMSVKKFFRVTPEEHARIAFNAAASGLEESSYLRVQALGKSQVRHSRRIRADWNELRRCMGVINKAGNVVNQFLMEVRVRGSIQAAGMAQAALNELVAAARAIVAALREI